MTIKEIRAGSPTWASLVCALALIAGCSSREVVREYFREPTPHEAYVWSLGQAGLLETSLGKEWLDASGSAVSSPLGIDPPYEENGVFERDRPEALGYRLRIRRGERLRVELEVTGGPAPEIFVDLFRAPPDSVGLPAPVTGVALSSTGFEFEPRRDGEFVVRVQPALLQDASYRLRVISQPIHAFPVEGQDPRAIQSVWGDSREGGRRQHEGVDIFAPRGTPALASVAGVISRVDTTRLGGRVVWLRDRPRGHSVYYAHLDRPLVREGQRVQAGDTLGLVGNTGNARTTPPHLHYGIYRRGEGAIDPYTFLAFQDTLPNEPAVALDRIGEWVRVRGSSMNVRTAASRSLGEAEELSSGTPLRILAVAGAWLRVALPGGETRFAAARLVEAIDSPLEETQTVAATSVRATPREGAVELGRYAAGSTVPVLGAYGDYVFVQGPEGAFGWMSRARPLVTQP